MALPRTLPALFLATALVAAAQTPVTVASPDGQVVFTLAAEAASSGPALLRYSVDFHGKRLIEPSELGLQLEGQPDLGLAMHSVNAQPGSTDVRYTIPVGKTKEVRDHYNSLVADFSGDSGAKLAIEVRAFDDGVAFRYVVPEQPTLNTVRISGERTQFRYSNDATLYPLVVNGFQSSYEDDYQMRTVGSLHPDWLIALPLLAQVPGTGWVAITEANHRQLCRHVSPRRQAASHPQSRTVAQCRSPGRRGGYQDAVQKPVAGAHDRRYARAPDRVEHDSQSESAFEDRRHLMDSGRKIGMGLVVGRHRNRGKLYPGHEHRNLKALH